MSHYVDGFVLPVPKANLETYRKLAEHCGHIWIEHGALQYWECAGDDVPPGTLTSFPLSVQLKDDEVVFFSWIVYESREERDRINKLVMADPRMSAMGTEIPFDSKRMIFGGFKSAVELKSPAA